MILELSKIKININEKITWKNIFKYEKILKQITDEDLDYYNLILFFIDNLITSIEVDNQIVTDKLKIDEFIFNPDYTSLDDLNSINSYFSNLFKKKIN